MTTAWFDKNVLPSSMVNTNFKCLEESDHFDALKACFDMVRDSETLLDLGCGAAEVARVFNNFDYTGADLPHIVEEATEDKIWKSVETALKKLIEEDLGKAGNDKGAGKGKEVVEGGVGQATGDAQFGGGKRAKTGIVAIPECQDAALLAKQV